ncbi:uncharacterized protein Nlg1 [Eurosta solidaginis]|uniref:uncharacterized protein Nlg1 n=1 Tax=Eurosta solidaginis TaxID=178769 RepID=UPI0035312F8E
MYFRCCHCCTSFAAIWLFWMTIVCVQQNRLNGDGCSGATTPLYAATEQHQSTQIFQSNKPQGRQQLQLQLQTGKQDRGKPLKLLKTGDAIVFVDAEKNSARTSSVTEVTTATRQVIGDVDETEYEKLTTTMAVLTKRIDKMKPPERPSGETTEVDSNDKSVERIAIAIANEGNKSNNNAVSITKANRENINRSHTNSNDAIITANNQLNITTKSLNGTKTKKQNGMRTTLTTKIATIMKMKANTRKTIVKHAVTTETSTSSLDDGYATTTNQAKNLIVRNVKQSKNLINSEHLAFDFKVNMGKLFAEKFENSSADANNVDTTAFNLQYKNNNNNNDAVLNKMERVNSSSNNNNVNDANKATATAVIADYNSSEVKRQSENNYNINNKLIAVKKYALPFSADAGEVDVPVVAVATDAVDDLLQLEVTQSINKDNNNKISNNHNNNSTQYNISNTNNNSNNCVNNKTSNITTTTNNNNFNNKSHNKYSNKVSHTNERRHIVPEKLQYTKEIVIKQGKLMGITRNFHTSTGLRDVDQYFGLPYAEAPIGSRRFMPPGAPLPWSGLKIARHLPPVCPQQLPNLTAQGSVKMSRGRYKQLTRLLPYLKTESEDCLYLNVYVPRGDGIYESSSSTYDMDSSGKRLPVMVYVHGESFEWNSGNPYDGSVLASYGQVIVVTINYRLGVMGFLKPSIDENTVANFGLLDQIAALHWIKENIGSFGGDKDSVTLMGHSTGAACVNYLMISPVASGLFHRAILMSGSAMSDWAVSNHSLQLTMQVAHTLNCPLSDDNEEMLSCLRQKRYQDILKIPTSFSQFSTSLGPIVDGHVIPHQPYKVMGQYTEHFSRYDLLFGITESESYHSLGALALDEGLRENERDNLLRFYMQTRFDVRPDLALAATLKKYEDMYNNPSKGTNLEHRDVVLDILSDARVVGPLMQTGLFHADVNRRNYMYVFGHNSAAGPHASLPHSITGEELAFVFGAPLAPAGPFPSNSYSAQEKLLAEAVMTYWTNFAKTGNPKAPWKGNFINLHALEWDRYDLDWPEFNKRTQVYLNIGIPPSIGYKYRQIYMNFWNKELPNELNQIANIQRQPYLHTTVYGGGADIENADDEGVGSSIATQLPRGHTAIATQSTYPIQQRRGGNSEVITGHMSQFGTRDNSAEDPVRTLKLLLQEPWKLSGVSSSSNENVNANVGDVTGMEHFAENMYNAPPTFGVTKHVDDEKFHALATTGFVSNMGGGGGGLSGIAGDGGSNVVRTNNLGGFGSLGVGTGFGLANDGNAIYGVPRADIAEDNNGGGAGIGFAVSDTAGSGTVGGTGNKEEVAKSETTIQVLIGLITTFIVLNVIIYTTFLVQKRKKAHAMQRKLGGILSYDGTTDDEFKRSKQNDGDESYMLDIVRKSNTYEAVKTERSPINGFKMTRQLSTSTVDTHTKVCAWMSAAAGAAAEEAKACAGGGGGAGAGSSKGGSKKSSSPTFSSLRSSSAGGSFKQPNMPQKVSVSIDATPQARSGSVLEQEPIEMHKLKTDGRNIIICQEVEVIDQDLLTPQNSLDSSRYTLMRQHSAATEACEAELPQHGQLPLVPQHAHSHSDPVDMQHYYSGSMYDAITENEKVTSFLNEHEDINVTSRADDAGTTMIHLTPAQQLQVIKSRNYPKVLPTAKSSTNTELDFSTNGANDSPPMTLDLRTTNKRNSLPPNSFLPHFSGTMCSASARYPPLPPPRTISTLGRKPSQRRNSNNITTSPLRLAYDCTTEEDEEPPITQNTLIVGPIVPQQQQQQKQKTLGVTVSAEANGIDANYSTFKHCNETTKNAKKPFNKLTAVQQTQEVLNTTAAAAIPMKPITTTTAMHQIASTSSMPTTSRVKSGDGTVNGTDADPFTLSAGIIGVTTFLSGGVGGAGLQSFESQRALIGLCEKTLQQQQRGEQQQTHHTERTYAVQEPANLSANENGINAMETTRSPAIIKNNLVNSTGSQNCGMHNNIPNNSQNNNNKTSTDITGITDIYAQPNKSAIKAKLSASFEQSNIPTTTTTGNSTTDIPPIQSPSMVVFAPLADNTITSETAIKQIAAAATTAAGVSEGTKSNHTTTITATAAGIIKRLGATDLANSGIDKQMTVKYRQTSESIATTINNITTQAIGEPQVLRNSNAEGKECTQLQQHQQQQQEAIRMATLKRNANNCMAMGKTATLGTRVPVISGMSAAPTPTIANAIAAQLAQTKPLKASLAAAAVGGGVAKDTKSTLNGSDSSMIGARDSCLSSVSTSSASSRISTESTTSSNSSAATDASSWSTSSSSSTETVRTELQQKTNAKGRPTEI